MSRQVIALSLIGPLKLKATLRMPYRDRSSRKKNARQMTGVSNTINLPESLVDPDVNSIRSFLTLFYLVTNFVSFGYSVD